MKVLNANVKKYKNMRVYVLHFQDAGGDILRLELRGDKNLHSFINLMAHMASLEYNDGIAFLSELAKKIDEKINLPK